MDKIVFVALLLSAWLLSPTSVYANDRDIPEPLCLPALPHEKPSGCQVLGPQLYINQMSASGIQLPQRPLRGTSPDIQLAELPFYYVRLSVEQVPLFTSLESAIARDPIYRYLEPGFKFATLEDYYENNGRTYSMVAPGIWMRGGPSRISASDFQGLQFSKTPVRTFGWVMAPITPSQEPGGEPRQYNQYDRYEVIQVYATQEIDGADWLLIGPEQWVDERYVALVRPNPQPQDSVTNGRWIEVNLDQQTVAVYENNELVYATVSSTGLPGTWTQPGLFQIYQMKETETMSGSFAADRSDYYYLEDVPWTMYFDQARALHGTYWHDKFGSPRSKGCVNLSPGDAQWLFNWAQEGDWVYIWDPTGETPTDEELYGAGGA